MNPLAIRPYLWMLMGCLAFTFMGNFTYALSGVSGTGLNLDWQWIAFFRAGLVFFFSLIISNAMKAPLVFRGSKSLWLRSVSGSISLVCTFYAMSRLQLSLVLTITNMFPLWVACLSYPLLGKPADKSDWLAVISALIGVAFIQKPDTTDDILAMVSALIASLSTAFAMIGLHKIKGMATQSIVVHFSGLASFACLCFLPGAKSGILGPLDFGWNGFLLLLGVGLSATIGQTFLTMAFAKGVPTKVAVIGLSQVVFALVGDIFFWDKIPHWNDAVGMAMIVIPTAWTMLKQSDA